MEGSRGVLKRFWGVQELPVFWAKKRLKTRSCMAGLLRSIVQEVPAGQMVQGTPFRCLPWPTPPNFKVLGGGKGEVKPPKCPTPKISAFTC